MRLKVAVDGVVYDVEVEVEEEKPASLGAVFMSGGTFNAPAPAAPPAGAGGSGDGHGIRAPLSGSVSRILVEEGQEIAQGDVVLVLEAMKMETEITAPEAGTVSRVLVSPADTVAGGQVLVELS